MFNIQKHLRHVVLALGLAAASLTAGAVVLPTYHISFANPAAADLSAIDFLFTGGNGAAPVTATLSHFTGIALTELDREGEVNGTSDIVIGNGNSFNYLLLEVDGPFAFDLNFSEGFLGFNGPIGSSSFFSIALYDSLFALIGDEEGALQFSLSPTGVAVTPTSSLPIVTEVAAAAVPEPADWMLMLTGLAIVAGMTRMNGRGRTNAGRLASA